MSINILKIYLDYCKEINKTKMIEPSFDGLKRFNSLVKEGLIKAPRGTSKSF